MSSQPSPARKESSKIGQGVLEMSASLPSSSSGRFSLANADSSTRIQVIISPDPSQNHEHTLFKDTSTAASLQDESIGVNEKTPPVDLGNSKEDLYLFAVNDEWQQAVSIFEKHPEMVRTPLTANGDTVLHIAVSANSVNFVQGLLSLVQMTPQDLVIQNYDRNTAFCVAAILGNGGLLKIMMDKNGDLPLSSGQDGMLPVHLAVSSGHRNTVDLLSSDDLLGKMEQDDIEQLFLMTISSDIFDVATKLFGKYRDFLAVARSPDEKLTALHILARKPSKISYFYPSAGTKLFKEVWSHVSGRLGYNEKLELITKPSTILFDAMQSGNDVAAKWILENDPGLLTLLKDSHGRNPLHYAALYRRESVLKYILLQRTVDLIKRAVDSERNNVLHLAASYQSHEALSRLDTKMQRELAWFKEVEEIVPRDLRTMKNSEGQTPKDIFYASHRELSKEVKETVKGIANSGMLVAALIGTVAYAAALTDPGNGKDNGWFVVFFLTNTVALFASSASIISFLSTFTSAWFIQKEFIISQTLIKVGLASLVVSVGTMVLSFIAASVLIFGPKFKWVKYAVFSMGVPPVLLLLVLRSKYVDRLHNYFDRLYDFFSWSRY